MLIDPAVFAEEAIAPETAAENARIIAALAAIPDRWAYPVEVVRKARAEGRGPFPLMPASPRARRIALGDGISARLIAPENPRGIYLHIHGGGWTFGSNEEQDPWLDRLAENVGLACVTLAYRLAPEHPYPAAVDDCEAGALALAERAKEIVGIEGPLFIGGESAGAHLALLAMLRLRDRHGTVPFAGANLFAGCYDLSLTPSVRNWGETPLVLNTDDIARFSANFLAGRDPRDPDASPLYADLSGLPPCLVSVGTKDPLVDDSLFLAARLAAAGVSHELALWPGGCHVFTRFPLALTEQALARIDGFFAGML